MYQYGVIGLWPGLAVILCYNGQMEIYKRAVCEVFVLRVLPLALGAFYVIESSLLISILPTIQ